MSIVPPIAFQAGYVSGLVGMQMRNMDAVATAQQKLLEGLGMLAKQQSQFMESSLRRAFDTNQAASPPADVRGLIGTRIDDLKSSILEAQARSNAVSEIMMRSLGEVAETLQTRMLAALDEFKALLVADVPSVTLPGAASPAVAIPRKTAA